MPRDIIQYKGLDELSDAEREILNTLSSEYYDKIKGHFVKNITQMEIHLKTYDESGGKDKKRKFAIDVKVTAPTKKVFSSNKSADWDFARSLHKAFNDIENQIKKTLHTGESHPRPRHIRK